MNKQYEIESAKLELLINRKNEIDPDFYNGIYDRYKDKGSTTQSRFQDCLVRSGA